MLSGAVLFNVLEIHFTGFVSKQLDLVIAVKFDRLLLIDFCRTFPLVQRRAFHRSFKEVSCCAFENNFEDQLYI